MAHLIVEYSGNLECCLDLEGLIENLHLAAMDTGALPLGGLRTRAARRSTYRIADGNPENAFIHVLLKIGHGRDRKTRQTIAEQIFKSLTDNTEALYMSRPLGLSFELVEIDPNFSLKKNNLHEYVRAAKPEVL